MVIVTPEVRRRRVLTSGNPHGFSSWVPNGGHTLPIAILGTRLT